MDFEARKLMFKAWNKESKLLMRLDSIECHKGELIKKDHILLQFTGLYDQEKKEIYEMDIVLIGTEKSVVKWDAERNGWMLVNLISQSSQPFMKHLSAKASRLWNFFEIQKS